LPAKWWHATADIDDWTIGIGSQVEGLYLGIDSQVEGSSFPSDLEYAASVGNLTAFTELPHQHLDNILNSAVKSGHVPVMRLLLELKADVHMQDMLPFWAAHAGHISMLKLLLFEEGTNIGDPLMTDIQSYDNGWTIEPDQWRRVVDFVKKSPNFEEL